MLHHPPPPPPSTPSDLFSYFILLKEVIKSNPASLAPKWTFLGLMTRFGNHLENCFKRIASLHAALWHWVEAFQQLAERKLRSCREPFFVFFSWVLSPEQGGEDIKLDNGRCRWTIREFSTTVALKKCEEKDEG